MKASKEWRGTREPSPCLTPCCLAPALQPRARRIPQQLEDLLAGLGAAAAAVGQGIEGGLQVGGQVVGERELLPRGGMGERQLELMQELALEPQVGSRVLRGA